MRCATLLLVALCGCAGAEAMGMQTPAPVVAPPDELGLHPGETMAFEVQLGGILVGEAQLAVGEIGMVEGHKAVVVRSRAATAGAAALLKKISDEATTVIDVETFRPVSLETVVEQSGKRVAASATFTGNTAKVTYQRSGDKEPKTSILNFGTTTVHDAHTAMAALRGWKGTKGQTRTVFVVGGRRLWRVDVTYAGEETIGGALGNRRAIVFDGKSFRARSNMTVESDKPARTFKVWLSDDADRVPIKVTASTELGEIAMDLVEYNRP